MLVAKELFGPGFARRPKAKRLYLWIPEISLFNE
jgi:hypothetical protein